MVAACEAAHPLPPDVGVDDEQVNPIHRTRTCSCSPRCLPSIEPGLEASAYRRWEPARSVEPPPPSSSRASLSESFTLPIAAVMARAGNGS